MRTVNDIDVKDKRVLIRVDFNVPLDADQQVTDDTRIKRSLPTIKAVLNKGGSVVLMSHLGRPKNGPEEKFSLSHVVVTLSELLDKDVQFADDCIGEEAFRLSASMMAGDVLLLNNLRFYSEEKKGEASFAEKLSGHGDVYINDAFGTAHRAHASTATIAQYFDREHKAFGLLMAAEIENAQRVLENTERPFTAIIGGAKVSSKIDIIKHLLNTADNILIGGGMAYTFFKAMGGNVGSSLVEDDKMDLANEVLRLGASDKNANVVLPKDSLCADAFSNEANVKAAPSDSIADGWMGLDIGVQAIREFSEIIRSSKTILWNGPMGVFEMDQFKIGTEDIAHAVASATDNGSFSLVGGGDSVAAVNQLGFSDRISYVSTGGGAMLEFFEGKELPGVAALLEG
ncbi:MAG: phosphoglycerate kinase [Bacteroidetes bacterium]|nr:phosphoglycerate kinase [Bacteroidota bacterium]